MVCEAHVVLLERLMMSGDDPVPTQLEVDRIGRAGGDRSHPRVGWSSGAGAHSRVTSHVAHNEVAARLPLRSSSVPCHGFGARMRARCALTISGWVVGELMVRQLYSVLASMLLAGRASESPGSG